MCITENGNKKRKQQIFMTSRHISHFVTRPSVGRWWSLEKANLLERARTLLPLIRFVPLAFLELESIPYLPGPCASNATPTRAGCHFWDEEGADRGWGPIPDYKNGGMWEGREAEDVCQKPPSNHSDKRFSSRALSIKKENIKQVSNKLKNWLSRSGNFFQVKTEKKPKHKEKIRLVHFQTTSLSLSCFLF